MGDILGMHGTFLHDAVGGTICTALSDALYVPYGTVHADVRIFQSSCTVDAVWAVCQEEGTSTVGTNGGVCLS